MASPYAFVTLLTSDSYLPGALALAAALNDVHPSPAVPPEVDFQTVCLVTPETIDVSSIKLLRTAFNVVIGVEVITQRDAYINLQLLGRPDLNTVLTKLHVFRLTQYSKIIFLDADVLPVRPLSHLFSLPHEFSAVPDVGWPDIFNSGVLVLTPGEEKFNTLNSLLQTKGTWDGGDQGILNEWRGGDWNRLSFTYNTTPTGIYSYAPAYERFGSHINAIHFIGPDKPWNSLLNRAPGSSSSDNRETPTNKPSQVYDYDSLVNKWYAVYDKHYLPPSVALAAGFEPKRYTSAWDEDDAVQDSHVPATAQSGAPLGLEDLRRIAVEGMSTAGILGVSADERHPGLGDYQSLPLEGRIDLMRPRHEEQDNSPPLIAAFTRPESAPPTLQVSAISADLQLNDEKKSGVPSTPAGVVAWHINLPDDGSLVRMYTLPTPAPHEIPATPQLRALSLPSIPPTPSPLSYFHGAQSGVVSQHHFSPPVSLDHEQPHSQTQEDSQPYFRSIPQHVHHQEQQEEEEQKQQQLQPQDQNQQSPQRRKEERRPAALPLIAWNPAVEPPPTEAPANSAFARDTYFPNTWNQSPSKDHHPHHEVLSWNVPAPDSMAFFEEPPPSDIPENLVRQGDYRKVTGEQEFGATPSPDRNKVKRIFPWEEKPRQLPGRHFPVSEALSPGAFLVLGSPSPSPGEMGESFRTPERQISSARPMPSPLSGLPSALNYANAWDNVPSIQRYASRLVHPSPPPALLAPPFEVGRRRRGDTFRSWDRTEVSSRDGDDEDNADESEAGDENVSQTNGSGSEGGTLRRRASMSLRSPILPRKKYMSVGVQTIRRDLASKAVQVSIDPSTLSSLSSPQQEWSGLTINGKHPEQPTSLDKSLVRTNAEPDPITKTPPLSTEPRKATVPSPQTSLLSGVRSPREFSHSTGTPMRSPELPHMSPLPRPPAHTATPPRSILPTSPLSSTRTHETVSPPSSIGPLSPPDGMPVPLPMHRGGRVWDPARGVELLRKESEEVLARFLSMGSWEDEATAVHGHKRRDRQ